LTEDSLALSTVVAADVFFCFLCLLVLYKKEVDKVERLLRNKQFNAVGMSSDKSQAERIAAIENFKSGKVRVLVATDVAGRGLDINDIALVINYSFPLTIEDYVHRIGRTGRGGKTGESITFFTKNDKHLSGELCNVMREAGSNVPGQSTNTHTRMYTHARTPACSLHTLMTEITYQTNLILN